MLASTLAFWCQSFHVGLITGMLQADPGVIRDNHQIFRLFVHETQRVFHDRLINNEDKFYFHQIMAEMASKHFGEVSCTYITSWQKWPPNTFRR